MNARIPSVFVTLGLLLMALAVRADDAQDAAEAKRRGITVAQVQAEKALAADTQKTADAEKTLAEMNKKLGEMQAAAAASAPAGSVAGDGAGMYKDFVRRYMAGNWDKLAADISARQKDIAALPQQNKDDLAYIHQAVTDGRQAWWDAAKSGKAAPFKAAVWKDTVTAAYVNGAARVVPPAGAGAVTISWPSTSMDSLDPVPLSDLVGLLSDGNFRRGDGVHMAIWGNLALAELYQSVGPEKMRAFSAAERTQFTVYSGFWSAVTSAYYGTPNARRLVMVEALASFEEVNVDRPDWLGKRPIGAAVLIEMKMHKNLYTSVKVQTIIGLSRAGISGHEHEMFLAKPVYFGMQGSKLTFEEDKAFREVFKTLAEKNTSWNVSKIALANDLSYDLNVQDDLPLSDERKKFIGD